MFHRNWLIDTLRGVLQEQWPDGPKIFCNNATMHRPSDRQDKEIEHEQKIKQDMQRLLNGLTSVCLYSLEFLYLLKIACFDMRKCFGEITRDFFFNMHVPMCRQCHGLWCNSVSVYLIFGKCINVDILNVLYIVKMHLHCNCYKINRAEVCFVRI